MGVQLASSKINTNVLLVSSNFKVGVQLESISAMKYNQLEIFYTISNAELPT